MPQLAMFFLVPLSHGMAGSTFGSICVTQGCMHHWVIWSHGVMFWVT